MQKEFWRNPYQRTLKTKILSINGNEILFDKTIAYSFSGGQENDKATINEVPILSSRMDQHYIYYILPDDHGFSVGDIVKMEIDWPRRNRLMRLHFACELILALINRMYGNKKPEEELLAKEIDQLGIEKVGAHIGEDSARIDFRSPINISKDFPVLLTEYKKIIEADLPIEKGYLDEESQKRYWRVAGLAMIPCGGTHVRSTGEIGMITLKRENVGKGIERIKIKLVNPLPTDPGEFERIG